ncbi:MAG TPA: ATP-dependent DNA helicase RecG [Terriglobales bacterium]|jgi:ATP-dependent DNA helicase RecG|nr:ATP-dependent DNA helicase RecG [Terriglobales bacterium]
MLELTTPVQYVKGIGPRVAEVLAGKGIHTVDDLLHYLPFRYEDRLNPRGIAELSPGEMATVIAEVRNSGLFRTRRMPIFQMTAGQGRSRLKCLWFHGAYLKDKFKPGQMVALYGKVEMDRDGELQIIQPQFEILGDASDDVSADATEQKVAASLEIGRIVPIYETAGQGRLTSRWFRRILRAALDNLPPELPEPIPAAVRRRLSLISPREALWRVHWPDPGESLQALQSSRTPAHVRLIFEELFLVELGLELKRREQKAQTGIAFKLDDRAREAIKKILPFHPTAAQKRVLKEIASDMEKPVPMRRLLQGDVGSGKTIVAFEAAIIAMENGYQVALMAPTEILAQQHYFSARRILETAGYRIVLLTGSLEDDRKRETRRHIARGNAQFIIGTHALIEQKVEFDKLGLVIVDEQHRFGVLQRFKLMKKSEERLNPVGTAASAVKSEQSERAGATMPPSALAEPSLEPDVLVMTATPIPRTLALTLYGDLDISILDEMPPGRTPIVTRRISDDRADEVWAFVRKQAAAGHQVYVVYPVIEENEENELKAAMKMYKELSQRIFPDLRVSVLHGRLDADLKDQVMRLFQKGEIDILVSTTVIEVGVDVANATVMVIEHAERFGLAQLHQLRGRIGRGAAKSYCILMTGGKVSEEGERRLDAMVRTTDGFQIAELDLELRGPGEFFGTRQAGLPSFQVAHLIRDRELLEVAKREAAAVLAGPNTEISQQEINRALFAMRARWQRTYGLVEVG